MEELEKENERKNFITFLNKAIQSRFCGLQQSSNAALQKQLERRNFITSVLNKAIQSRFCFLLLPHLITCITFYKPHNQLSMAQVSLTILLLWYTISQPSNLVYLLGILYMDPLHRLYKLAKITYCCQVLLVQWFNRALDFHDSSLGSIPGRGSYFWFG